MRLTFKSVDCLPTFFGGRVQSGENVQDTKADHPPSKGLPAACPPSVWDIFGPAFGHQPLGVSSWPLTLQISDLSASVVT